MNTLTRPHLPLMEAAAARGLPFSDFPLLTKTADGHPFSSVWVQFDITPATSRRGLTTIKLHAGVVDEMALEFFCYGGCCLLAAAMHERSGWPLMVYYVRRSDGRLTMAHMGVQTPQEEFLDVQGVRSYASLCADYGDGWRQTITLEEAQAQNMIHPDGWRTRLQGSHTPEIVQFFADQMVTQAGFTHVR